MSTTHRFFLPRPSTTHEHIPAGVLTPHPPRNRAAACGGSDLCHAAGAGLAIYKPHDSAPDKTPVLIEYRSFTARDRVSYLITTEKSEPAGTTEPDPLDLKGNLKKIQGFYSTSQNLEATE